MIILGARPPSFQVGRSTASAAGRRPAVRDHCDWRPARATARKGRERSLLVSLKVTQMMEDELDSYSHSFNTFHVINMGRK